VHCTPSYYQKLEWQVFSSLQVISSYSLCQASDETYPIQEKLITHSSLYSSFSSNNPKTHNFFSIAPKRNFLSPNTLTLICIMTYSMTYVTRVCLHDLNNLANKLFTTSHQASWLAHQTNSLRWLRLHLHLRLRLR
jgi:hypothetical protein